MVRLRSTAHLPAAQKSDGVTLVAICDSAPDILDTIGSRYQVPKTYTDYREMFADRDVGGRCPGGSGSLSCAAGS